MLFFVRVLLSACFVYSVAVTAADQVKEVIDSEKTTDLDTSATSAKLFNLGSLFGQYPSYGYGNNWNYPDTNTYRPTYRPNYYSTSTYYPSQNSGNYYPTTSGFYPSTSWPNNQYPGSTSLLPNTGYYYPSGGNTAGSTAVDFFPNTGGTNVLGYRPSEFGAGGYGGYGGNGGLRQYAGYWNPAYVGQRNRGYGYFADTDRYGLPQRTRGGGGSRDLDRDHIAGGYRGYD